MDTWAAYTTCLLVCGGFVAMVADEGGVCNVHVFLPVRGDSNVGCFMLRGRLANYLFTRRCDQCDESMRWKA